MNLTTTLNHEEYRDKGLGDLAFFLAGAACVALCLAALAAFIFTGGEPHLPATLAMIHPH